MCDLDQQGLTIIKLLKFKQRWIGLYMYQYEFVI